MTILKKVFFFLILFLCQSGTIFKITEQKKENLIFLKIYLKDYSFYEIVTAGTLIHPEILHAVAFVESGENDSAIGDYGFSKGRFQIHEKYREENIKKYGFYDPHEKYSSAMVAIGILQNYLLKFGSIELALTAYNGGPGYVYKNGINWKYVNKIKKALLSFNSDKLQG